MGIRYYRLYHRCANPVCKHPCNDDHSCDSCMLASCDTATPSAIGTILRRHEGKYTAMASRMPENRSYEVLLHMFCIVMLLIIMTIGVWFSVWILYNIWRESI